MKKLFAFLVTLLACLLPAQPALAAKAASTKVVVSCSVAVTPLAFPVYDPIATRGAMLQGATTATVTCTCSGNAVINPVLSLSRGRSTSYALRTMVDARGNTLAYNVYTDAARSIIFGDGSSGTSTAAPAMANCKTNTVVATQAIYGQVQAAPNAIPGTYSDAALTLTISY